ncbi:MAG TPA: hypothetical protein VL551_35590 [Actinospica sp.]|jgi:hypothetical protein|nr:hypothetical protein [Actinospica sp.]
MSDSIEKFDTGFGNLCPLYIEPAMLGEDDVLAHSADLPAEDTEEPAREEVPTGD